MELPRLTHTQEVALGIVAGTAEARFRQFQHGIRHLSQAALYDVRLLLGPAHPEQSDRS